MDLELIALTVRLLTESSRERAAGLATFTAQEVEQTRRKDAENDEEEELQEKELKENGRMKSILRF